jgi:hypothetical protein
MTLAWGAIQDDTPWLEKAMDEYHNYLQRGRGTNQPRRWKFSDVDDRIKGHLLQRAAEMKLGIAADDFKNGGAQ